MAKVRKKRVSKKPSLEKMNECAAKIALGPEDDKVKLIDITWRDQKTLTALGDDGIVYQYRQTNRKWFPISDEFSVE